MAPVHGPRRPVAAGGARADRAALHRQPALPRRVADQRRPGQRRPDGQQQPRDPRARGGRGERAGGRPVCSARPPASRQRRSPRPGTCACSRSRSSATAAGVGTLRVANPLTPVSQAQSSLRRTFVVVGIARGGPGGDRGSRAGDPDLGAAAADHGGRRGGDARATCQSGPGRSPAGGEVGVLAAAFDEMLDRLERAFKRQRDFVSDASHELRTPLSVLRAQVELLDRETDEPAATKATVTAAPPPRRA